VKVAARAARRTRAALAAARRAGAGRAVRDAAKDVMRVRDRRRGTSGEVRTGRRVRVVCE
jgi:hypothetical protein